MTAPPPAVRHRDARVGGCVAASVERRADGSILLRSVEPLRSYPQRLTDRLEHWAAAAPQRTFVAQRAPGGGEWVRIGYAQMLQRVRRVAQALVDLQLSVERPVAVLSGNDIDHLTLALAAMWAGVPCAPISSAYSLVSQDHARLRGIIRTLTPGLLFASGPAYAKAIDAVAADDATVVLGEGRIAGRATRPFSSLLEAEPGASLDAAHAMVGADGIAKFLFTSGSTKTPKAVINTHRMLCANQQMIRQCLAFLADEPPVLVDWLPWSHTFGGNHNIGIALFNGGTLYIDEGRPTPDGIAATLRNLREIAPTIYFNVPKGFEELAGAMDRDSALRDRLFSRCKAFMFAGAGLSQPVWDRLDAHGEASTGERVRIITGFGMTETAPACTFAVGTGVRSGQIGLPVPGVEVKLVTDDGGGGKTEIRFRGANVMPGYWRAPAATGDAFDAEGFYRSGDAVAFVDPDDPQRGLRFDGRIGEDFKLDTGTFVSVGPLRASIIVAGEPCVQDAVITGSDRGEVGALLFPRADDCRRLAGAPTDLPLAEVLQLPRMQSFFQQLADRLAAGATGSANRIARLQLLAQPPSIDAGELTDKGSINQHAVLARRAALVDAMYEARQSGPLVIVAARR